PSADSVVLHSFPTRRSSDLSGLPVESQTREDVRQIQLAGERAAALTGQLLAYARRTMVAPRIADLNQLVLTMQQMLRRLIGEDIDRKSTRLNSSHVKISYAV